MAADIALVAGRSKYGASWSGRTDQLKVWLADCIYAASVAVTVTLAGRGGHGTWVGRQRTIDDAAGTIYLQTVLSRFEQFTSPHNFNPRT